MAEMSKVPNVKNMFCWLYLAIESGGTPGIDSHIIHASFRETRRRIDTCFVGKDFRNNAEAMRGRPVPRGHEKEDNASSGGDHLDDDFVCHMLLKSVEVVASEAAIYAASIFRGWLRKRGCDAVFVIHFKMSS